MDGMLGGWILQVDAIWMNVVDGWFDGFMYVCMHACVHV